MSVVGPGLKTSSASGEAASLASDIHVIILE
jgi:hypothetical protein